MNKDDEEIFIAFEGVRSAFEGKSIKTISENMGAFIYAFLGQVPKEDRNIFIKKIGEEVLSALKKRFVK